jgi:hypothetical protein
VRRLLVGLLIGAIGTVAVIISEPPAPPTPLAGRFIEPPGLSSPVDESIWYCPWAQSTGSRDSLLAVASLEAATASLTFPVAIPGEVPDEAVLEVSGPGAAGIQLSSVAQRGDSPSYIEFSAGPAAAAVVVEGDDVLAADACVAEGPDVWHFAGGSTMPGEHLVLRLFNPFLESARVTVTAISEFGVETIGDLRTVTVLPEEWVDIAFEAELPQREELVVSVETEEGTVVPAMAFGSEEDEDWWAGVGESLVWEFPVARSEDLSGEIMVANVGSEEVQFSVDVLTPDGTIFGVLNESLPAQSVMRVEPSVAGYDISGARLEANAPVVAALVSKTEAGVAVMPGVAETDNRWLVPGPRVLGSGGTSLWLLNSSEETISVTVSEITDIGLVGEQVVIEAGRPYEIQIESADAVAFVAESSALFSVAWVTSSDFGISLAAASPVSPETEAWAYE